jgi:hypothetical protein
MEKRGSFHGDYTAGNKEPELEGGKRERGKEERKTRYSFLGTTEERIVYQLRPPYPRPSATNVAYLPMAA